MIGAIFLQKMGVVDEYLVAVDKISSGGSDGPSLVRELAEETEHESEYRSCASDSPKPQSSSSSSSSSSDNDFDPDNVIIF